MRARAGWWTSVVVSVMSLSTLASCRDSAGPETGTVHIAVASSRLLGDVAVIVSAADIPEPLVWNGSLSSGSAVLQLDIPTGVGRHIHVVGFDGGGFPAYAADTVVTILDRGNSTLALTLEATEPGGTGAASAARIVVTPDTLVTGVGDTTTFSAMVLDAAGVPTPDQAVTWATDGARTYRIGSNGLGTAMAIGSVHVLALAGSAVGFAEVHVVPVH